MGGKPSFIAGVLLTLAVFFCATAAHAADNPAGHPGKRLKIIATLFPQYDFARQIARDKANVRLLLPPGAESHSFEPTPADMKAIASADLFIYTGDHMEPWARRIIDSAAIPSGVRVVDASHGIALMQAQAQADEEEESGEHEHREGHANRHDGGETHEADHVHNADPHIWLDPVMAGVMVDNIGQAMAEQDSDNEAFYLKNSLVLGEELDKLDNEFSARIAGLSKKTLVFGERFPFTYFFDRYDLVSASPFNSCGPGAEPGPRAVIEIINTIKKEGIKYIYVEAMTTSRMAAVISRETGAEILYVDSLHNPPLEKQLTGISYQSVMRGNMDAFVKGLE